MPKYDVFAHPQGQGFLLDVQSDLLGDLNTRIVVPLMPESLAPQPATRLNPVFDIGDGPCVMVTQFLAAVPVAMLKNPVGTLEGEFAAITAALDMLMQGF